MSLPSNGITQEVIRDLMPPYYLSPDLLEAMFAAMPPPPADASATWRQVGGSAVRLLQEFSTLMRWRMPSAVRGLRRRSWLCGSWRTRSPPGPSRRS